MSRKNAHAKRAYFKESLNSKKVSHPFSLLTAKKLQYFFSTLNFQTQKSEIVVDVPTTI
jgi:hypothetical protein